MQRFLFLVFGILILVMSCKPSFFCDPSTQISGIQVSFFTYKCPAVKGINSPQIDSSYRQIFYKVFSPLAKKQDSAIYQDSLLSDTVGRSNLTLPLSNFIDSVYYIFEVNTSTGITPSLKKDTLRVRYTRILHYISKDCGYNYYYTLNSYSFTNHYFNFITLVNSNISPTIGVNYKFYNIASLKKCKL